MAVDKPRFVCGEEDDGGGDNRGGLRTTHSTSVLHDVVRAVIIQGGIRRTTVSAGTEIQ
jgi:hypothetical protein